MIKAFARSKSDVSKAAIDFFSFGHLIGGYFAFIVLDALFFVIFGQFVVLLCIFIIFLSGTFWELIENTIFYKKNIKFGYRRDSLINSVIDIIMFTSGGIIAAICFELNPNTFLITTTLYYIINVLLMSIYADAILGLFRNIIKKKSS
jgi:hypothetical protein